MFVPSYVYGWSRQQDANPRHAATLRHVISWVSTQAQVARGQQSSQGPEALHSLTHCIPIHSRRKVFDDRATTVTASTHQSLSSRDCQRTSSAREKRVAASPRFEHDVRTARQAWRRRRGRRGPCPVGAAWPGCRNDRAVPYSALPSRCGLRQVLPMSHVMPNSTADTTRLRQFTSHNKSIGAQISSSPYCCPHALGQSSQFPPVPRPVHRAASRCGGVRVSTSQLRATDD